MTLQILNYIVFDENSTQHPAREKRRMDCGLVLVGRFLGFLLLFVQLGFLTAFPVWYRDDKHLISLVLLFFPSLIYYGICLATGGELRKVFLTWGLYISCGLIPYIAIIFALCGDVLDKNNFLSPTCLKVILCITPVAFLILVNTAGDLGKYEDYKALALTLSVVITIDLVDSVEMLDIVLEERENSHGIPKELGYTMIAAACVSFLLTLLQIAENKLHKGTVSPDKGSKNELNDRKGTVSLRDKVAILANLLQIVFVNLPFMAMRLVVIVKYNKDNNESIFITKNVIAIFLSAVQIYWIQKS